MKEKNSFKRSHTICFRLYNILKVTKYRDEKQISACQGLGMVKGKRVAVTIKRQHKRFFFLVIIYFCIRITMELHELHTGLSGIELF